VFKRILQQRDEDAALQAVALMHQANVVDISSPIAMDAAKISAELKLPMADSFVFATARACDATLWTQDSDFKGLPNVKFTKK
ncbi:MAG: type II toxin-antitoxin system VapC family toxin, partial [Sedimentisphaerales bacterium]|nr:type II toxin-antitoxin system VapC family toxin [Sedimentisphaerales bacterium]